MTARANDPFDFTGKVALVTGSSRGIGAGIISALGKRGARCVVNYVDDADGRNKNDAEQLAGSLAGARIVQCDVGDPSQIRAMMEFVKNEFGGLDFLVNNAGIRSENFIRDMTADQWDSVLGVNLSGAFHCTKHAIPLLRSGGSVVNISSVTGQLGMITLAGYSSSKAGLIGLTKVAARELAAQNITVNAIAPGFIKTGFTEDMNAEDVRQILTGVPLGHFGEIDDVVNAALFLCSADARYITGQVLNVNGGLYL